MPYNLRTRPDRTPSFVKISNPNVIMANPVLMTTEQLTALIEGMKNVLTTDRSTVAVSEIAHNFSKCQSRFGGKKDEDCDAFIDAISVYKECLNISDDNAIKGLPMLLDGLAATWFQGAKNSFTSWAEVLTALRRAFGFNKPSHQIFKELFSKQQADRESTDVFVNSARALLARLPATPVLDQIHQIDMIYGLLNRRIRQRVSRDDIKTFDDLITKARSAEDNFPEKATDNNKPISNFAASSSEKQAKLRPKCNFCKHFGHVQSDCRKYASRLSRNSESSQETTPPAPRNLSHITCFGCGTPGYIRSQCPNCNPPTNAIPVVNHAASLELLSTNNSLTGSSCRPLLLISVLGKTGLAYVDSGAKCSMAGSNLYSHLLSINCPFKSTEVQMVLADGRPRTVNANLFECTVQLQDRSISTTFVAIPDYVNSKTLLGADFIMEAQLILNLPGNQWSFSDDPNTCYALHGEPAVSSAAEPLTINSADMSLSLRNSEAPQASNTERAALETLIQQHGEIFRRSNEPTPFAEHRIPLTDDTPISVPPYRLAPAKKEILRKELDTLLQNEVIEECESPFAAPVVLVPKKDGTTRLCVDYRRLNAVTRSDKYPLPRIDDLLHSTCNAVYMTTLDLKCGYHQVPVRVEDRDKTAFITPFGTFRYRTMPFGLKTAPATFQRLIDRFRSGLQHVSMVAYLDDLIILSPTFETHLRDLKEVFERLTLFKLTLNRPKCTFGNTEVEYLGHILTQNGIAPNPEKIRAIARLPAPKNVKQLLTFLQTCSWFRRFVERFSEVARPLSSLTKKKATWEWGPEQESSFRTLKNLLTTSPILRQADPSLPFTLRTDASSYAIGAALLQGEGPDERPVEYASRLLTAAEIHYHTTEREALSIVWAVNKFRGYLEGSSVVVRSDHQPLRWLMTLKSPSGRLARWALALQPYDLKIEYTPGRCNALADALSRPPCHDSNQENCEVCLVSVDIAADNAKSIRDTQIRDPDLNRIIECLESPDPSEVDIRRWGDRGYVMLNGVLYRYSPEFEGEEAQQVVPKSEVLRVLKEVHDSPLAGHYGVERTLHKLIPRYYWSGMRQQVAEYVARCIDCQRYKITNLKPQGLVQTPVQAQRFEVISIDLFGPLPETATGDKWVFIVEDTTSRWVELFPLKVATAEACARCLIEEIILRYGNPRRVISDNGVQFISEVMQKVALVLDFKQNLIPSYYPAANPVERRNRDLKTQLAILTGGEHSNWRDKLACVRFAMNTTRCQSTGFTPAYLTFARELRTPGDATRDLRPIIDNHAFVPQITPFLRTLATTLSQARDNHEKSQDNSKKYADKTRRDVSPFRVNELVLVDTHVLSCAKAGITSKFAPRRDGPYVVLRKVSPTSYQVAATNAPTVPLGTYHVSALVKYVPALDGDVQFPLHPIRKRGRPPRTTAAGETNTPTTQPLAASDVRTSSRIRKKKVYYE